MTGNIAIVFQYAQPFGPNENKSKLIKKNSDLYKLIKKIQNEIVKNGHKINERSDLHMQIVNNDKDKNKQKYMERIKHVKINVSKKKNWAMLNKAFVLNTGGHIYGTKVPIHITIAFEPGASLHVLRNIVNNVLKAKGYSGF